MPERAMPWSFASISNFSTVPSRSANTVFGPLTASSSSPPWPCTTHALVTPRDCSAAAILSMTAGNATPTSMFDTGAGFAMGPSRLNTVGMPISRRDGPAWRNAGWNRGARQKPNPVSVTHSATPAGSSSTAIPAASSTSAAPQLEEAALLPCLHTGTPAPATTSAAIVETLTE